MNQIMQDARFTHLMKPTQCSVSASEINKCYESVFQSNTNEACIKTEDTVKDVHPNNQTENAIEANKSVWFDMENNRTY